MLECGTAYRKFPLDRSNEHKYEHCVLCGKQTAVKVNTHIDMRDFYVEGCGQLCRDCWVSVYDGEKA